MTTSTSDCPPGTGAVYFVMTQEITDDCGCGWDGCMDGTGPLVALVFARSRGHAKYLFWKEHRRALWDFTETPWRTVRLVYANPHFQRQFGVLPPSDPKDAALWRLASRKINPERRAA